MEILMHVILESDWPVAISTIVLAFLTWHLIDSNERKNMAKSLKPWRRVKHRELDIDKHGLSYKNDDTEGTENDS